MGNYTHPFCLSKCRQSNTETLVISGALDHRTPPEIVDTALMPFLTNGRHIIPKIVLILIFYL